MAEAKQGLTLTVEVKGIPEIKEMYSNLYNELEAYKELVQSLLYHLEACDEIKRAWVDDEMSIHIQWADK